MPRWRDIDAVVFDMDGLVLDTEKTYRAAWREAGRALGYGLADELLADLSGLAMDAVLARIAAFCGPGFEPDAFNRLSAACWRAHVAARGIEVKPGFHALRDHLLRKNMPFCLATNSRAENAAECLDLAGLDGVFATVIARDHVVRGKPAPDLFLRAAAVLGVPIGRCLVLEDSPAGIEAAIRAGAIPVMVPSTWPVAEATRAACRWVLNDLAELIDAAR